MSNKTNNLIRGKSESQADPNNLILNYDESKEGICPWYKIFWKEWVKEWHEVLPEMPTKKSQNFVWLGRQISYSISPFYITRGW